jgi:hypothetical protein
MIKLLPCDHKVIVRVLKTVSYKNAGKVCARRSYVHQAALYVYIHTLLLALLNICVNLLKFLCDLIRANQIHIVLEICFECSLSG